MNKRISPNQFDFDWFRSIPIQKRKVGNPGSRRKVKYLDIITAFDIETTRIKSIEQSIMYVWAWQFGKEYTVVGRTWDEFKDFAQKIADCSKEQLMVFVHNLSYEFQFLRGIYDFSMEEVFCLDRRKILKMNMYDKLEMRCSYLHSNMSLNQYTKKMGAEHAKLSGEDFDYSIERYPWTELTEKEWNYIVHDVLGLVEAIEIEMKHDGDNLYSFPLTSTGYVRRDAKKAMREVPYTYVKNQLPNFRIYQMLREAFRGGDTHANRYYADITLENVKTADRSSSYPAVICNNQFPVSEFFHAGGVSFDDLMDLINVRKKAVLMRVSFTKVELIDKYFGAPYLSRDKSRNIENAIYDNGRILSAEYLETTITDIDLKIILSQYKFEDFVAMEVAHARYGDLPQALKDETISYYEAKTSLKNVKGQELYYDKSKNKLNSVYGMMVQDPAKPNIHFIHDDFIKADDLPSDLLSKHNQRAFLAYQWGVWVTAHARYELQEGIRLVGDGLRYYDTDGIDYQGEVDWTEYNARKISESKISGAYATDPNGVTHYMGVFEEGGTYDKFKTLGAKKYCTEKNGKLVTTIAGVSKAKGGDELLEHGGIEAFTSGFIFTKAGGTDAIYNDKPEITEYEVEGRIIPITSNVVLKDGIYTLGITAEYQKLLEISAKLIDI